MKYKWIETITKINSWYSWRSNKWDGNYAIYAIDQEGGNNIRIMEKQLFTQGPMTISATNINNAKKIGH